MLGVKTRLGTHPNLIGKSSVDRLAGAAPPCYVGPWEDGEDAR